MLDRLRTISRKLKADYGSLTVGLLIDHAKAIRVPLLVIVLGIVLTFWVDQIHELFLLLTTDFSTRVKIVAWLTSGVLGFAVWYTARTVYRFNIPSVPALSNPCAAGLRRDLPRVLGALIPLLMAIGVWTALRDPALKDHTEDADLWMPWYFVLETITLLAIFITRRRVFRRLGLPSDPAEDPRVNRWSQLPRSALIVYRCIFAANILAVLVAMFWAGRIAALGPLAVVLLCATFFTVTGTYLTIQAARWQFPLLSALFAVAVLWQFLDWNDNHRVRLYTRMHSYSTPQTDQLKSATPLKGSLIDHVKSLLPSNLAEPVYVVSAEGGGIRASAWTAMVLIELEQQTKGEFSKHMLLGSGVSGGSLGLALFAAMVKGEREGSIRLDDLPVMNSIFNQRDFLGPTLEAMFLTDSLQRFLPGAWFIDRGETLESSWEQGWTDACEHRRSNLTARDEPICTQFGHAWTELWPQGERIPMLVLNSTEVATGERFIEHPFERIDNDDDALSWSASTVSTRFLPASAPLSAVVHNSARFTYISPAGTLLVPGQSLARRQLVDGGYFENSAATTLGQIAVAIARLYPACSGDSGLGKTECPIRWIHISNDPSIEALRADQQDACPDEGQKPAARYGEIRAPVFALLDTRDARAVFARAALRNLFVTGNPTVAPAVTPAPVPLARAPASASTTQPCHTDQAADLTSSAAMAFRDERFYHFRLCNGQHHLPLGWNLSDAAMCEMKRQLEQEPQNLGQLQTLLHRSRPGGEAHP